MDLTEFLVSVARLRGEMLTDSLEKCKGAYVSTVDELRELASAPDVFDDLFPGLLRVKIRSALEQGSTSRPAAESTATKQIEPEQQTLPEGKRYTSCLVRLQILSSKGYHFKVSVLCPP